RIALRCIGDRNLVGGLLVLLVGNDRPAPERLVVAGVAVDLHPGVDVLGEALLGRRSACRLQRREDDFFRHVLFPRQRVDEQQQFAVQLVFLHSIFGTNRALSMLASAIVRRPASVSSRTLSPSTPRNIPFIRRALSMASRSVSFTSSPAKRAKSSVFF